MTTPTVSAARRAVVISTEGTCSFTLLPRAKPEGNTFHVLSFNHNQWHFKELKVAGRIYKRLDITLQVIAMRSIHRLNNNMSPKGDYAGKQAILINDLAMRLDYGNTWNRNKRQTLTCGLRDSCQERLAAMNALNTSDPLASRTYHV